jgi:TPR repeat protein
MRRFPSTILALSLLAAAGCQDGCRWGKPKEVRLGDVEALDALRNVDIPALLGRAQAGDAQSQYDLGYHYLAGSHVKKDPVEARRWFVKAAEQGHRDGQFRAGMAYAEGYGAEPDYAEALRWFRSAAEQGMREAQFNLALALAEGRAGAADPAEAATWYRKASEQGMGQASVNLGTLYEHGQGVARDLDEALRLYLEGAEEGIPQGAINAARLYIDSGDCEQAYRWLAIAAERGQQALAEKGMAYCAERMTEEQVASATEAAAQWQPRVLRQALEQARAQAEAPAD